jgi:ABC-type branched-subunit amino acid transport system permease subunit
VSFARFTFGTLSHIPANVKLWGSPRQSRGFTSIKLYAFIIRAMITAIAGAVFFMFREYISPADGFNMSCTMIFGTVIGGISTEEGAIIGTVIIVFFQFFLARYAGISLIIQGSLMILIMLLAPQGIMDFLRKTRTYQCLLRLSIRSVG